MISKKILHAALPLICLSAFIASAHGKPLPLQNAGFEYGPADIGYHITDWPSDLPFREPGATAFIVPSPQNGVAPEGKQDAIVMGGRFISQTVPDIYYKAKPGDVLTLTVAQGPNGGRYLHAIQLNVGGKVVAANSESSTVAPKDTQFADSTVTYIVQPQNAGRNVTVVLQSPVPAKYGDNAFSLFDNVRLDVSSGPATPQQTAAAASNAYTPPAPNNPPKGYGVYSIGHSFHFLNYSMPELLTEIACSAGLTDHHIVGIDCMFGSMMDFHWQPAQSNPKSALVCGAPDILTMVALFLPDEGFEKFSKLAYLGNPNIRIFIQENWLTWEANNPHYWYMPPSQPRPATVDHNAYTLEQLKTTTAPYTQQYDDMIRKINQDLGKQVVFAIPMGSACIDLRGKIIAGQAPGLKSQNDIFGDALGHPTAPLQALTAYCFYAAIYKKSPEGLPVPSVIAHMSIPPDQQQALNHLLQQIAWDEVSHNPLSGIAASP